MSEQKSVFQDISKLRRLRNDLDNEILEMSRNTVITASVIKQISEETRLSVSEVQRIINYASKLTEELVIEVLKVIKDGEFTTYGNVAAALGRPNHYRVVGQILSSARDIEALAAPVIRSVVTRDVYISDSDMETKDGWAERAPWFNKRGIPFKARGNRLEIHESRVVSAEELSRRLSSDQA